MAKKAAEETGEQKAQQGEDSVEAQEAQLPEAQDQPAGGPGGQIEVLLDMPTPISAQLGQIDMQVRDVLRLGPGSVLRLDKQVGEPVDMFLCGTRFATGQLVVVGDQLAVRVKEILAQNRPGGA